MNLSDERIDDAISHYRKLGFAKIENVCSPEILEKLRARADELMLGRIRYPGMFFQHDTGSGKYEDLEYGKGYEGASLNYRKIEKLELDPEYLAWIENPLFEKIARKVIQDDVVIYRALIFAKAANGGSNLPWHQDGGKFWGLDRDPELQIWTALDDVPIDSGCVEVFPGSHLAGLATPLGGVVPDKQLSERTPEAHALAIPARAGDIILIHNHLWHRSGVNKTPSPRRAFTVCYMSAATRCLRKKREPRVFFPVFRRASS
jgi:ectoine hydroxylase-related dioxygenase (phytanoyl-CoA dioxygenase family)